MGPASLCQHFVTAYAMEEADRNRLEVAAKRPSHCLEALAYPRQNMHYGEERSRSPNFDGEEKFWDHCLRTMPIESANALYLGHASEYNSFNRVVHDPLHDYFAAEVQRSDEAKEDFEVKSPEYMAKIAVRFLASWNLEEDTPILNELLRYRGYELQNIGHSDPKNPSVFKDYKVQVYSVRAEAKDALFKRGVTAPKDILVERDVSP